MMMSDGAGPFEARLTKLEGQHRLLRDMIVPAFWQALDRLDEETLVTRSMTCPICARTEPHSDLEILTSQCRFGGGRLIRYLCPGCGCIYGPAKFLDLGQNLIEADYALLYSDYDEGDSTVNETRTFRSLDPQQNRLYLNWGCGRWNSTIPTLRAEGYDVWGYEPTAQVEGCNFVAAARDEISARFDGLFSNNVIEHMIRPVEEFRYFHSILSPGGRMAHASPCYRYSYADTRFHVVFLTGDSPHVLAERSGFRVIRREDDAEFINLVFERA
jgi:hypothetical protein